MAAGNYALTAKATDNLGAATTSAPVSISVKSSLYSVLKAKGHGNKLLNGLSSSSTFYAGAADGASSLTDLSLPIAADLDSLTSEIESAYGAFLVERNSFGITADRIDSQIQAALYFSRADTALAAKSGASQSVKDHLRRLVAHLSMTEDLMVYGSISGVTADEARAANALTDVIIGPANVSYGSGAASFVAPGSLASAFGDPIRSPLSGSVLFAALYAGGSAPWELAGVNVTVGGIAVPIIYTSPARLAFYVPADLPLGPAEVIITSQDGHVSRGVVTIAKNVSHIMTTSDDYTGEAIALNGGNQIAGSFDVTTGNNFGNDKRTRVSFFATGISGSVANTDPSNDITINGVVQPNFAESVVIEARTQNGRTLRLPVEFAGAQGIVPGLDAVTVVLTNSLKGGGTVQLTLTLNGQTSNASTIVVR